MQNIAWQRIVHMLLVSMIVLVLCGTLLAQDMQPMGEPRPETDVQSPIALDPATGSEIGFIYQAYLSPQQEGGEEQDTPFFVPPQFRSTTPSVNRNDRTSRGHAVMEITRDLSTAYVFLAVENVNPADVVMLHLHCGLPGQLGPIIIDFSMVGSIQEYLADGSMSIELHNEDIVAVTNAASPNPIDGFTLGCPITTAVPTEKVRTIAGLQMIAQAGEIYFNLHTAGQTYFGDMRGQFSPVANFVKP